MSNKLTYTEVLQMINDKFDKLDEKIDRLDHKLDKVSTRVTVVETKADSNKGWGLWLWGAAVTAANIIINLWK